MNEKLYNMAMLIAVEFMYSMSRIILRRAMKMNTLEFITHYSRHYNPFRRNCRCYRRNHRHNHRVHRSNRRHRWVRYYFHYHRRRSRREPLRSRCCVPAGSIQLRHSHPRSGGVLNQ